MLTFKDGDSGHNLPFGLPHSSTNKVNKKDYLLFHQQTSFPVIIFTQAIFLRKFSLLTFTIQI